MFREQAIEIADVFGTAAEQQRGSKASATVAGTEKRMDLEFRTLKLKARGAVVGGDIDAALLDSELDRARYDGWQLVSAWGAHMDQTARYFVMVLCREARRR